MKDFIKQIFSDSDQKPSSKRIFGAIGFLSAIVLIFIYQHDMVSYLMYVSASLLGLDSLTQIFKR